MKPFHLALAVFLMGGAAMTAAPQHEPASPDYRDISWVEDRTARLIESLTLTPEQAVQVRAILTMEHELALRDRRELAGKKPPRPQESREPRDGGFGRRGAENGHMGRGMTPGVGPIDTALVERARQRYRAGEEKLLTVLTDDQKSIFHASLLPRKDLTDEEIMLAETLDLNDTQIDHIKPVVAAKKSKIDTIMAVGGDRQTLFQAMREAVKDFDDRIAAELNKDQKKIFRKLRSRPDSRNHDGPPGGDRDRRDFNR